MHRHRLIALCTAKVFILESQIFVSGDMNIDFVDFDTGKKIPLDQQLVTVARGLALSSIHQLEITGWLQWLGLLTNRTAVINRKRHLLKWNVEMYDTDDKPILYALFKIPHHLSNSSLLIIHQS